MSGLPFAAAAIPALALLQVDIFLLQSLNLDPFH